MVFDEEFLCREELELTGISEYGIITLEHKFEQFPIYFKRLCYQRDDSSNITAIERRDANARHAVGDGHRGQTTTTFERFFSDASHLTCPIHVCNFIWNNDVTFISITRTNHLQFQSIIDVIVIDGYAISILYRNVIGKSLCSNHAHERSVQN